MLIGRSVEVFIGDINNADPHKLITNRERDNEMLNKKTITSVVLMLTVAPLSASLTLVLLDPGRWGGSLSIVNILMISAFGMITGPLWVTYCPALIITPIYMQKLASKPNFYTMQIGSFVAKAIFRGAIGGVIVLSPAWILTLADPIKFTMNWLFAGAVSGAITGTVISVTYRNLTVQPDRCNRETV
jgi:hypothetical protein